MTALPIALMSDDEVARFGRDVDGSFGALQTARGALPLAAMEIDARVVGVVAAIEVAQKFVNTTGVAIEATYIFPLPDRAAVHRFRMEVAGRVVEGVVEERGAAREQYDEAIAQGHRAAIAEEERSGVFTLRVGNLMPGESAIIRLSLVGPLPVDDGEITLRFPLVVAPRYMPGVALGGEQAGPGSEPDTSIVPDASRISPPRLLPGYPNPVRLGIRVALVDHDVREVTSSLHAVTQRYQDAHIIELGGSGAEGQRGVIDRDFILRWRVDPQSIALGSSLVCVDDADGAGGSFALTLMPPSTATVGAKPRQVAVLLDRSGSMQGWKMVAARRATARIVDSLTSRDEFVALAFDDRVDGVPDLRLAPATDRNRFRAVEGLAKLDARGGTELMQPLKYGASLLGNHDDREHVIVLVTDGQVGNEDQILRELAPALRKTRVFTLGIDQAVNAGFLRKLAAAGAGLCELVESEDRLDEVMGKVHRRIGTPIATELSLEAEGIQLEQVAPTRMPDVYAGAPVVVFGRYRGRAPANAAVTVVGSSLGEPLRQRVARTVTPAAPSPDAGAWLAASWARARIRDLEDRYATGDRSVETEIVRVSTTHGVLSRFTAYLAIDRSEFANRGGRLDQHVQAVEEPAGWESRARFAKPRVSAGAVPMSAAMPRSLAEGAAQSFPELGRSAPPASKSMVGGAPGMIGGMRPPSPSSAGAPPMPPGGPRAMPPSHSTISPPAPPRQRLEMFDDSADGGAPPTTTAADAYLTQLAQLARELATQARGRLDAATIRVLRQRLTEWVEDVRSVGHATPVAARVEALVQQLGALLAAPLVAAHVLSIALELEKLATGGMPPSTTPVATARGAFWK